MTTQDDDFEKREFIGDERKEIRGIMFSFRLKKRIREALKVWIVTAGVIVSMAGAASTIYTHWVK
jgi:hypothetical protein